MEFKNLSKFSFSLIPKFRGIQTGDFFERNFGMARPVLHSTIWNVQLARNVLAKKKNPTRRNI